jgi:hypothetical protein
MKLVLCFGVVAVVGTALLTGLLEEVKWLAELGLVVIETGTDLIIGDGCLLICDTDLGEVAAVLLIWWVTVTGVETEADRNRSRNSFWLLFTNSIRVGIDKFQIFFRFLSVFSLGSRTLFCSYFMMALCFSRSVSF